MKKLYRNTYKFFISIILVFSSCNETIIDNTLNEDSQIILRWFSSYPDDSFQKNRIALDWCLSYLGANTTFFSSGTAIDNKTIILDINQLGFSEEALSELKKLHQIFKNSEEYQAHGAFDIGKYIAMTFGSSYHYYKIVGVPERIDYFTTNLLFSELKGYVDQSSISLPGTHRVISYTSLQNNEQTFISDEINPSNQEIKEFEIIQRMPNGQLKYGIYNSQGDLIPFADNSVTAAGKPAKCIWCHEVNIQPLFNPQNDFAGFLPFTQLRDSLNFYRSELLAYQDDLWSNPNLQAKTLHTNMELSYITFMEPSAERLALEWNITIDEVQNRLQGISTHRNDEFDFLGVLYNRQDVIPFSPYQVVIPPGSIREASNHEPNLLQ